MNFIFLILYLLFLYHSEWPNKQETTSPNSTGGVWLYTSIIHLTIKNLLKSKDQQHSKSTNCAAMFVDVTATVRLFFFFFHHNYIVASHTVCSDVCDPIDCLHFYSLPFCVHTHLDEPLLGAVTALTFCFTRGANVIGPNCWLTHSHFFPLNGSFTRFFFCLRAKHFCGGH